MSAAAFSMVFRIACCTRATHTSVKDLDIKFWTPFSTAFPSLGFWPSHPNNFSSPKLYPLSSQASETTVPHSDRRVPHGYDLANALEEKVSVTLKKVSMHIPSIRGCSTLSPTLVASQWLWTCPECILSSFCSCAWGKHWCDSRYSLMAQTRSPLWTPLWFPPCLQFLAFHYGMPRFGLFFLHCFCEAFWIFDLMCLINFV